MAKSLQILLVEDNDADAELVEAYGAETTIADATIARVAAVTDACDAIHAAEPDVILLDLRLPDAPDGSALARIRQVAPDVPIIVLTGMSDEHAGARALAAGAQDYLCKGDLGPQLLARTVLQAIERRRLQRQAGRSRAALRAVYGRYKRLVHGSPLGLFIVQEGRFVYANARMSALTGYSREELLALRDARTLLVPEDREPVSRELVERLDSPARRWTRRIRHRRRDGTIAHAEVFLGHLAHHGRPAMIGGLLDVSEEVALQERLQASQRLEAIGHLSAGIAHEINTPTQFVGDNVAFLKGAWSDLEPVLDRLDETVSSGEALDGHPELAALVGRLSAARDAADVAYLRAEVPLAIQQAQDGLWRVAEIVRAMNEFSHPGAAGKSAVDLNHAIEVTVTLARNTWKHVADVELQPDPTLPPVPCVSSEISQVLLNLLVNATQAIAEVVGDPPARKGRIVVSTRQREGHAEVAVSDSGCGIPADIQHRIFEPFFTTKEVGQGTGQGLALAHHIIAHRHGGEIGWEPRPGGGTTFVMRLPIDVEGGSTESDLARAV